MKTYREEPLVASDTNWMLEKLGTVVEMVGGDARVIVTDGDKDRLIQIPTSFWIELKYAGEA